VSRQRAPQVLAPCPSVAAVGAEDEVVVFDAVVDLPRVRDARAWHQPASQRLDVAVRGRTPNGLREGVANAVAQLVGVADVEAPALGRRRGREPSVVAPVLGDEDRAWAPVVERLREVLAERPAALVISRRTRRSVSRPRRPRRAVASH
jgi:hypothetical protein